jgi:hypothetical protein
MPDPARPQTRWSRRRFLALAASGAGAGALAIACGREEDEPAAAPTGVRIAPALEPAPAAPTAAPPLPTPTPAPRPVPPAGLFERPLLPGTPWETTAVLRHSGVRGPTVLVLGGVHGNEPGGWLAAETLADVELTRGSLIVVPRANIVATRLLQRTTEELGDLNRLYPGSPLAELPMARMASRIVSLARQYDAELLLDMHESWQFYVERTIQGTAAIGQTMSAGPGPEQGTITQAIGGRVNAQLERERELLLVRTRFGRRSFGERLVDGGPEIQGFTPGRGSSSLSMGNYVPGLTPVLVEMGQQNQAVERRIELHRMVVHAALELREMV